MIEVVIKYNKHFKELFIKFLTLIFKKTNLLNFYKKENNIHNDICCICLDDLDKSDTFQLDCSHIIHTSCLVEWFRRGNNTCPYCKDTGSLHNTNTQNVFNLMINNNIVAEWKSHPDVQNYLNIYHNDDLTKEFIIKAYVIRDEGTNISLDQIYNSLINKLGLSDEVINNVINNTYILYINKELRKDIRYIINENSFDIFYSHLYNNEENKSKRLKYQQLQQIYNQPEVDRKDIYNIFSMDDLIHMGW